MTACTDEMGGNDGDDGACIISHYESLSGPCRAWLALGGRTVTPGQPTLPRHESTIDPPERHRPPPDALRTSLVVLIEGAPLPLLLLLLMLTLCVLPLVVRVRPPPHPTRARATRSHP